MGYRSRLGRVAKRERQRFLNRNHDDCVRILEEDGDEGALYRPHFHEQLIELGKYCEFNIEPRQFYNGFNIMEECESEFHIMTKEMLKQIIREYHQNIQENYDILVKALEDPDSISAMDRFRGDADPLQFLKRRAREWNLEQNEMYLNADRPFEMYPYYLESEPSQVTDGFIARSWQYEYQIFNLTYIYRTFDWENDYLIYSAW